MKKHQLNYLSFLPDEASIIGDNKEGEIEIVTDQEMIETIAKKYQENLQSTLNIKSNYPEIGIILEDEYILVIRDAVKFPSGKTGTYLRIFERAGLDGKAGVVMVPFRDNLIYLREVFRHATRQWELELPRGYRPKDFSLHDAVKQEIAEELGFGIKNIYDLGSINSNTGLLAVAVQAYWVLLEEGQSNPDPEEGEAFGAIVALTPSQLKEKICAGEIRDGFTLSALQLAQAKNFLMLD